MKLKWKSCVFLPAAGRRTQLFHLDYTEPGNRTLAHPCMYCLSHATLAGARCHISATAPETKYVSAKFIHPYRHFKKLLEVSNFSPRDQTIMINLLEAIKNLFAFINSILESCFRSSGNGVKKNKSVRRRVQRSRTSGKGIWPIWPFICTT